jgi:hypothetical protein
MEKECGLGFQFGVVAGRIVKSPERILLCFRQHVHTPLNVTESQQPSSLLLFENNIYGAAGGPAAGGAAATGGGSILFGQCHVEPCPFKDCLELFMEIDSIRGLE